MRLLEADEERETRRVQRPKGNETIRRLMTGTHVSPLASHNSDSAQKKRERSKIAELVSLPLSPLPAAVSRRGTAASAVTDS